MIGQRWRPAKVRIAVRVGEEPPAAAEAAATAEPVRLSREQTIALLALSRGSAFPLAPQMRRRFLRLRLLAPRGSGEQRAFEVTDAGRTALGKSEHMGYAQRALDAQRRG